MLAHPPPPRSQKSPATPPPVFALPPMRSFLVPSVFSSPRVLATDFLILQFLCQDQGLQPQTSSQWLPTISPVQPTFVLAPSPQPNPSPSSIPCFHGCCFLFCLL